MSYCSAFIVEVNVSGTITPFVATYRSLLGARERYSSVSSPVSYPYVQADWYPTNTPTSYSLLYATDGSTVYSASGNSPSFPLSQTLSPGSTRSTISSFASNLAIKATTGGTVTGTLASVYDKYGTSRNVSAGAASSGFVWDGWYSSDTKDATAASCTTLVSTNTAITITTGLQDKTYCAKYTDNNRTLTVTSPTVGQGSVTVQVGDTIGTLATVTPDGSGNVPVIVGQYVRVSATPTATYKFVKWDGPGSDVSYDAEYTFIFPSTNSTVTVDFDLKTLYTIEWRVNDGTFPYNAGTETATAAGCTIDFDGYITPDPPIETDPADKWYEGTHSLTGTPGTGWRRIAWIVINADTDEEISRSATLPLAASFSFNLTCNTIIQCDFYKIPYTVRAFVHTASQKTDVDVLITYGLETGVVINDVYYNDTVTFDSDLGGYPMGGWYTPEGVLITDSESFSTAITEDTDVYLKVKGTVLLTATAAIGADGTVQIDDGDPGATATADVILGETCTILSTPDGSSSFDCWFLTSETKDSPIAGYDAEQVITVTDNLSLSSYVVTTVSLAYRYVAVLVYDNATGDPDGSRGTVSLPAASGVVEITKTVWESDTGVESPATTAGDTSESHKYYKFLGTKSTAVTATASAPESAPFLAWYRNKLTGVPPDQAISPTTESLGTANPITQITTTGFILKAFFGVPAQVPVTCGYVTGVNPAIGEISMEPITANRTTSGTTLEDIYTQATEVTFSTDVSNGYMFVGWYSDATGTTLVSEEPIYTVAISLGLTLFAKFDLDDHAIYKWEGGTANKTLTWRSKRYMSSKPFALSAGRIYADLYPVTLNVYVSSSPNAPSPTIPDATVIFANESARRLATIRREKYVEIEVVATGDVTQMAVAGSMEGLVP